MKGYYRNECSGTSSGVPSGRLSIEAMNLPEFHDLIRQAKKEADQLNQTIGRLENFELNIDFGIKDSISSES